MDLERVNHWLLLFSQTGILVGLILVGLQIQQDNELTQLQIFSETTSSRIQLQEALIGEDSAAIVMKSLTQPELLSLAELRVMDAYLIAAVNEERRRMVLRDNDLQVDAVEEEDVLLYYFGNDFAQAWWQQFVSEGEDMTNKYNIEMNRKIAIAKDRNFTLEFYRGLGERLNIQSTKDM